MATNSEVDLGATLDRGRELHDVHLLVVQVEGRAGRCQQVVTSDRGGRRRHTSGAVISSCRLTSRSCRLPATELVIAFPGRRPDFIGRSGHCQTSTLTVSNYSDSCDWQRRVRNVPPVCWLSAYRGSYGCQPAASSPTSRRHRCLWRHLLPGSSRIPCSREPSRKWSRARRARSIHLPGWRTSTRHRRSTGGQEFPAWRSYLPEWCSSSSQVGHRHMTY